MAVAALIFISRMLLTTHYFPLGSRVSASRCMPLTMDETAKTLGNIEVVASLMFLVECFPLLPTKKTANDNGGFTNRPLAIGLREFGFDDLVRFSRAGEDLL